MSDLVGNPEDQFSGNKAHMHLDQFKIIFLLDRESCGMKTVKQVSCGRAHSFLTDEGSRY